MYARLGELVSRHWLATILAWLLILVALRIASPKWNDVTRDGDLAFLPADRPSVQGEKLAAEAFPENRSKSQIVIIFAREDRSLDAEDLLAADRLGARFQNYLALRLATQARELRSAGDDELATSKLEEALEQLDFVQDADPTLAEAWHNRAIVRDLQGSIEDVTTSREQAWQLKPQLQAQPDELVPAEGGQLPLVDVWTRRTVFGGKLRSADRQALLVVLQLSNEFMATENIRVLEFVQGELDRTRAELAQAGKTGLTIGVSGAAAVGGDMLQAAAESIQNTELYTIITVIAILLVVYRAPLLVVVPLITIAVSLSVSLNILSILAQLAGTPGFEWWTFKIFKTTKIFIVVILYGMGTDFCLFLISRYREHLESGLAYAAATTRALVGVGDALTASAFTTILGLGMMFFADFGKFRNSGPAIGLCLFVTLLACLTLAPALLRACGGAVFWPLRVGASSLATVPIKKQRTADFWQWFSRVILLRPIPILVVCLLLMGPLAWFGIFSGGHITFDLLGELEPTRPSREGSRLLRRHFPVGQSGPIIVLANRPNAGFDSEDAVEKARAKAAIFDLTVLLTELRGIDAVRSLAEPLGDKPQRLSVAAAGMQKMVLQQHRLTRSIFLAQSPQHRGNVTRFELIPQQDPFSREAVETLLRVDEFLQRLSQQPNSFWHGATFSYAGTTAGIRDLRDVTYSDQQRIQVLVVIAVWLVLLVILRRPAVSVYLVISVVFSYLVTIGATEWFFQWHYGDTFDGLDWKVPIFLFVILVAVGEDYNVYLVTRVFEEQATRGPFAGLQEGLIRTGGIITSCGVIMAGTFVSMMTSSLRAITELGFALSLGVLLDTFVVRTVLVPAFLTLYLRARYSRDATRRTPVSYTGVRPVAPHAVSGKE